MAPSDFLFIHPLLGTDDSWSGYRVEQQSIAADDNALLKHLTESPLVDDYDQRQPWLLPVTASDHPPGRLAKRAVVVFPARPAAAQAEALAGQEAALRQAHRDVGLLTAAEIALPATGAWNYLLLTASHARSLPPFKLHGLSSRSTLVATDVHSHADRLWFLDNACSLSTGEFLLARATAPSRADTTRIKLLELLGLIAEDADTAALEAVFRQESKLSYSLLRLVNSAAMAPPKPITSFSQAINLLGRRQLQRWLQLLVYADPNNGNQPNPLLQKAAARGHLLESLAPLLTPRPELENLADAAFMVGSFSLLNVLLNMSMPEIMHQLPLATEVAAALTEHAGPLGGLLRAIHAAELRDLPAASAKLQQLGIAPDRHLDAQLAALGWAAKIRPVG